MQGFSESRGAQTNNRNMGCFTACSVAREFHRNKTQKVGCEMTLCANTAFLNSLLEAKDERKTIVQYKGNYNYMDDMGVWLSRKVNAYRDLSIYGTHSTHLACFDPGKSSSKAKQCKHLRLNTKWKVLSRVVS